VGKTSPLLVLDEPHHWDWTRTPLAVWAAVPNRVGGASRCPGVSCHAQRHRGRELGWTVSAVLDRGRVIRATTHGTLLTAGLARTMVRSRLVWRFEAQVGVPAGFLRCGPLAECSRRRWTLRRSSGPGPFLDAEISCDSPRARFHRNLRLHLRPCPSLADVYLALGRSRKGLVKRLP